MIKKILNKTSRLLILLSALGLILMTLIIGWQVFGRFILNQSPDWSEQAALALMIWYIFLAAAAGVRENFHIRIVALDNKASPRVQMWMRSFAHITVFLCGAVMFIYGLQLVQETWAHAVPTLPVRRGMVYLAVPIGGFLIAIFSIENIFKLFSKAEGGG